MRRLLSRLALWFHTRAALNRQLEQACDAHHDVADRLTEELAEHAETRRLLAEARAELADVSAEAGRTRGTLEVCKAQLELYALWEARERERLEAEAAIQSARRSLALGSQRGAGDDGL